uniref:Putative LOV domain-containing protein n=1 Tax=Ophioglossum vulgatum TaxID=49227 RepID=A0A126WX10_9MONI|nr:putative LOV domain-containing protein [Ophioglossum vulgatum]
MALELWSGTPQSLTRLTPYPSRYASLCNMSSSCSNPLRNSCLTALQRYRFSYVLTDPKLPDNPIVYASSQFLDMTGYFADEIIGRNCRFLQGPDTDRRTVLLIRDAVREGKSCHVAILNYTKQGSPFWNLFHMAPIFSKEDGSIVHFLGVQTPISECIAHAFLSRRNTVSEERCDCVDDAFVSDPLSTTCRMDLMCKDRKDVWEVLEVNKQKSLAAMRSLLSALSECNICRASKRKCTRETLCPTGNDLLCVSLTMCLAKIQQSFVLCDPHLPDTPVVYASNMFLQLTGYSIDEVIGHNCRFLQGPKTDPLAVKQLRESIKSQQDCTVRILNYRKDKSPFWNLLHVGHIRNAGGKVTFCIGVQLDATNLDDNEHQVVGMSPHMKQLGAVGAVRVAVRSLQGSCRLQKTS